MKKRRLGWWAHLSVLGLAAAVQAAQPDPEAVIRIARDVLVIPGSYPEGSQPDGNTVIFAAAEGLVVMDTGRHAEHTQRILDYATERKQPIRAIINSHWHLDHIGGNSRIRAVFPDAKIYASGALEGAVQGFLADYRKDLEGALQQTPDSPQAAGWRSELGIIDAAPQSVADQRIESSGLRVIAGRKLDIHLETHAVTAGDVWVFDPATRVLAAGDLVTLPVPFLDTACPTGWKEALEHVAHKRFVTLIPGHGPPMKRQQFDTYRHAYGKLIACTATQSQSNADCVEGWIHDASGLIGAKEQTRAHKMMEYYVVNILRGKQERLQRMCAG